MRRQERNDLLRWLQGKLTPKSSVVKLHLGVMLYLEISFDLHIYCDEEMVTIYDNQMQINSILLADPELIFKAQRTIDQRLYPEQAILKQLTKTA